MQNSEISWTNHTHNIVWGCSRVSPGCQHCYAETLAHRYGYNVWGPAKTTERRCMSDNYWRQPIKWNAAAEKTGKRARVFCGSMSDVFEDHPTNEQERQARLWPLIEQTPWLDWLLLTKRPENITKMIPLPWQAHPRKNVWYGTSVENQEYADKRIGVLMKVPAWVRFLSCEPLLGPVKLPALAQPWKDYRRVGGPGIHWVIAGGESGAKARPAHPDWFRALRDQCQDMGIAFHFKQWGEYGTPQHATPGGKVSLFCAHGTERTVEIVKLGKHAAGRLLDGRTWDELPV